VLDILRNALGWDLGPLNAVVAFSFLNFSVVVFVLCLALMWVVSLATGAPAREKTEGLTMNWAAPGRPRFPEVAFTAAVGVTIIGLWYHFR
jgi:hypothetical protein